MSSKRRKAREVALKVLYQIDLLADAEPSACLTQVMVDEIYAPALEPFALDLLRKHSPDLKPEDAREVADDLLGDLFQQGLILTPDQKETLEEVYTAAFPDPAVLQTVKNRLRDKLKDYSAILEFAGNLVDRTRKNLLRINQIIEEFADNWSLERMASMDRAILRFAICELLFFREIPINVTINEAVELAKKYSTEKSREFVNGILDKIHRQFNPDKDDPRDRKEPAPDPVKP